MYGKIKKNVPLKCGDEELEKLICENLELRGRPYPTKNLSYDIERAAEKNGYFDTYDERLYEPELSPGDKIRLSSIITKLIVSGKVAINFFDKNFSGDGFEIFHNK